MKRKAAAMSSTGLEETADRAAPNAAAFIDHIEDRPAAQFEDLPVELVVHILTVHLTKDDRFFVRRVSRLWREVVHAAGQKDDDRRSGDVAVVSGLAQWIRRTTHDHVLDNEKLDAMYRRWRCGQVLLASAAVRWLAATLDMWQSRPEAAVEWCTTEAGASSARHVVAVLAATGAPSLVDHAVRVIMSVLSFNSDERRVHSWHRLSSLALDQHRGTRTGLAWKTIELLAAVGNLESLLLALSSLPPLDWTTVRGLHWMTVGDHPDTVEHLLRLWIAANDSEHGLSVLFVLFGNIGGAGEVRVLDRLMSLAVTACVSVEDEFTRASTHYSEHHDEPDGDAETYMTPYDDGDPRHADLLAVRLLSAWRSGGFSECAKWAAIKDRTSVLALIGPHMQPDMRRVTFSIACRCRQLNAARWFVSTQDDGSPSVQSLDIASWAMKPYRHAYNEPVAKHPYAFLDWVFGPRAEGALAFQPTVGQAQSLFDAAVESDTACAFWWVERRTREVLAMSGLGRLTSFVHRACRHATASADQPYESSYHVRSTDGPTLERLVAALDLCAHVAASSRPPTDAPRYDLWRELTAVVRASDHLIASFDRAFDAVAYAWARTTGTPDPAVDRVGGVGSNPAPQASWQRWCRVRPISAGSLVPPHGLVRESHKPELNRATQWLQAKGLLDDEGNVHVS